jgi:DNA-binding transcriptional regulator YdaS (Cro superfamily)
MSGLPAEYYFHELKKLFGDYKPKAGMPCFHCHEPEAIEITIAFAQFGAAAHPRLPHGTLPALDRMVDLAEPTPSPASEPSAAPVEALPEPESDGLVFLRDYVLAEDTIMAAVIKAAGGIHVLARKLGISHAAIEQWKRIPVERLQAVAKVTGLPQHVLRPDLFPDVGECQFYWTEEEADEIWKWSRAWQLWLPLPYPPGFLPALCCARRSRLTLVVNKE